MTKRASSRIKCAFFLVFNGIRCIDFGRLRLFLNGSEIAGQTANTAVPLLLLARFLKAECAATKLHALAVLYVVALCCLPQLSVVL